MHAKRRLPAEWEPQDAVLLAWPHAQTDWNANLASATNTFIEIVRAIVRYEKVVIVAPQTDPVRSALTNNDIDLSAVILAEVPTNDTWSRDFGPITVYDHGQPLLLDFGFNGWGLKFAADYDNQVTRRLIQAGTLPSRASTPGLILEGGSIESDGMGTLLTTRACLLEANRNPSLSLMQLETKLCEQFGCRQILWLDHGYLAGDDTDSHIDTLARLAPNDTILYVSCDSPQDEHYPQLQAMAAQIATFRTLEGASYRRRPLPWPKAVYAQSGERLPATYANYLVINGAVLVPSYDDPADAQALAVIAEAFPEREVVAIDCRALIEQHGSLHCVTMQLPKGVLS